MCIENVKRFPKYDVGKIFNKFNGDIGEVIPSREEIELLYPCRLDAMAINPAAVCYNDSLVFTPGEVVISVDKKIKVKIFVKSFDGGELVLSPNIKRKVLVKHAYYLMCKTLNVNPSLYIDVDDNDIPKHCGFGSSSSTIAAVAAAINEIYSKPIKNSDLIKFLASNHGEEISDDNENELKMVQCIGGGSTNGLTEEGIIIISGRATTIAKLKYESKVLIGMPKDFKIQNADNLMKAEEDNLWKFKKTGEEYGEKIAYNFLHVALPELVNGKIKSLSDIVFDYRFNMGSIENCSFIYEPMNDIASKIRTLYEEKKCEMLALSSVGPAFFVLVNDDNYDYCKKYMEQLDMNVVETKVWNDFYEVVDKNKEEFWKSECVNKEFQERKPSSYITNEIDEIIRKSNNIRCADIGCGGGRYTQYLLNKNINVISIDKNEEMIGDISKSKINFVKSNMDSLPLKNNTYDLVLSIGVIHNAVDKNEYINSLKEIKRILTKKGKVLLSVFTNDVLSDDLIKGNEYLYIVKDRMPMVLMSKSELNNILNGIGFNILKVVDEHITDVGTGKRNVYTLCAEKI